MRYRIFTDLPKERLEAIEAGIDSGHGVFTKAEQDDGNFTLVAEFPGEEPAPEVGTNTPWMAIAQQELDAGVKEGPPSNPRIEEYFETTVIRPQPDSTPWCSAFVNFCVTKTGVQGTNSALAQSWLRWGEDAGDFTPGCIVVLARGSAGQGHVGFFVGNDADGSIRLLGGNQSNMVNITTFRNPEVLGKRMAKPEDLPLTTTPENLTTGSLLAGMPDLTPEIAQRMLPDAKPFAISSNLTLVLEELGNAGLTTVPIVLAAIATIRVETSGFLPISEFVSEFNTSPGSDHNFDKYDFRGEGDLGNNARGDGEKYKGRGFVQLTGKSNYRTFGAEIGVDLITDPEQANEPRTAAKLLAAFLKSRRDRIETALAVGDFRTARRAVNGGSHGLDGFTESYRTGEQLLNT